MDFSNWYRKHTYVFDFSSLDETVVINTKRVLLRPELHFHQVHETKSEIKKMKLNIPVLTSFFQKKGLPSGKFSLFNHFIWKPGHEAQYSHFLTMFSLKCYLIFLTCILPKQQDMKWLLYPHKTLKISKYFWFFYCYLTVPRPTLVHSQGDNLTNPMIITVYWSTSTQRSPGAS